MRLSALLLAFCSAVPGAVARANQIAGTDKDIDVETYLNAHQRSAEATHARALLASPAKSDVHADKFLPNFSVGGYDDGEMMIADLVSPIVKVDKATDKYVVWDRATSFATTDDEVGPLGTPPMIEQAFSSDNYSTVGRALESMVANDLLANADAPIDLLTQSADDVRRRLMRNREKRVADLVTSTSNYASALTKTLSGTGQWSDVTNGVSNPIEDIMGLLAKIDWAAPPNGIVMSDETWIHFRKHPKVCAAFGAVSAPGMTVGAQGPMATVESVKSFFGFQHVLIGNARRNTANPAASASYSRLWGKSVELIRIVPGATLNTICSFKTFRHQALSYSTRLDQRPGVSGATIVKGSLSEGEKQIAQAACAIIAAAIA